MIPNDRLLQLNTKNEQTFTWEDALKMADSVLHQGIAAITEVATVPGEINVDFADVKTILSSAGPAWLAIGRGKGEKRAVDAAKMATKSPLLDIAMDGAKRILFVITGGPTLTLEEIQQRPTLSMSWPIRSPTSSSAPAGTPSWTTKCVLP